MGPVPLVNSDPALHERVLALTGPDAHPGGIELAGLATAERAVDYLNVELPELILVNFADPRIDAFGLLDTIAADPWLLHGGIVALGVDRAASERLAQVKGVNVVVDLSERDLEVQLPRTLDIIHSNRRILFQREISADLVGGISGSHKLRNDVLEVRCYVNLICNFLFSAGRLDQEAREGLSLVLQEILVNAIEHGNCAIGYDDKTGWLEEGGDMADLIRQRCEDPAVDAKRVTFEYTLTPDASRFVVADEGPGFDWRSVKDPTAPENLLLEHGRGIALARQLSRDLTYNEPGNEVRFEFSHLRDTASTTPALLGDIAPEEVREGETVFEEGEPGSFLYYIAKGTYEVLVEGRVVSTLSPDDIFMGEMSFLLNNRRSATVRAASDGRLIRISKEDFVDAIRRKPHYALFLSRLLAQRVARANLRSARG